MLASCSVFVEGCGGQWTKDRPMLAFVLRRGPGPPPAVVSPDYDLGPRVSDERVPLGKFTRSGREAGASYTEFANALLVSITYTHRLRPHPEFGEMHCRVLDSTGRPLHFIGLHPAFFFSLTVGRTTTHLGLVFSKRGRDLARARVIVTTYDGEFEMMYSPVGRTPNPTDGSDAPTPTQDEGRETE